MLIVFISKTELPVVMLIENKKRLQILASACCCGENGIRTRETL